MQNAAGEDLSEQSNFDCILEIDGSFFSQNVQAGVGFTIKFKDNSVLGCDGRPCQVSSANTMAECKALRMGLCEV